MAKVVWQGKATGWKAGVIALFVFAAIGGFIWLAVLGAMSLFD